MCVLTTCALLPLTLLRCPFFTAYLPVSNKPLGINLIGLTLGGAKGIFLNKHIVKLFSELHSGCIKFYYLNADSVGTVLAFAPANAVTAFKPWRRELNVHICNLLRLYQHHTAHTHHSVLLINYLQVLASLLSYIFSNALLIDLRRLCYI